MLNTSFFAVANQTHTCQIYSMIIISTASQSFHTALCLMYITRTEII